MGRLHGKLEAAMVLLGTGFLGIAGTKEAENVDEVRNAG